MKFIFKVNFFFYKLMFRDIGSIYITHFEVKSTCLVLRFWFLLICLHDDDYVFLLIPYDNHGFCWLEVKNCKILSCWIYFIDVVGINYYLWFLYVADLNPKDSHLFNISSSTEAPVRRTGAADDFLNSETDKNDYEWYVLLVPFCLLFPYYFWG